LRFDEGIVGAERLFEDAALAANYALLLAFGDVGTDADGRKKSRDAGPFGAQAFAEDALRDQLKIDSAGGKLFLEVGGTGPRKGGNDAGDLAILEKDAEFSVARAAVVADDAKVLDTLAR
jgi:hypothetical protein